MFDEGFRFMSVWGYFTNSSYLAADGQIYPAQAVREVIQKLRRTGGEGGVIAVDRSGNTAMDFNSVGMFRGARDGRGRRDIAMYRDAQ